MIQVINKKMQTVSAGSGGSAVYIGRPSVLGNPFKIGKDGTREQVVDQYRVFLWDQIQRKTKIYQDLLKLAERTKTGEKIDLVCWCAPKRCHGEVIKAAIEWMIRESIV